MVDAVGIAKELTRILVKEEKGIEGLGQADGHLRRYGTFAHRHDVA